MSALRWLLAMFCGVIAILSGYVWVGLGFMLLANIAVFLRTPSAPLTVRDPDYRCPTCRTKDQVRYQTRGAFDFPYCYRCAQDVGPCRLH